MEPGGGAVDRQRGAADEDLIATASSGRALCGTFVGDEMMKQPRSRARKPVLRRPKDCKLRGSGLDFKTESRAFASIQSSELFCETVRSGSWSVGASGNWQGIGGGAAVTSDSRTERAHTGSHLSREACHMQCWYFPQRSFHIPRVQMCLTDEALDDVRRVSTLAQARSFLDVYNSHVSTGTYHLGGVLLMGVTVKVASETRLDSMLDIASRTAQANLNFPLVFKSEAKVVKMDSSSTTEGRIQQEAWVQSFTTAVGPQTLRVENFKAELLADPSSWGIIDSCQGGDDLVPLWEIIRETNADLQPACERLRTAWENSVTHLVGKDDSIQALLDKSANWSLLLTRVERLQRLDARLACIPDFTSTSPRSSPKKLEEILRQVYDTTAERQDEWLLSFELPSFRNLLRVIAQSSDSDAEPAKVLMRKLLCIEVQQYLSRRGVFLEKSVRTALNLQKGKEEVLPLPPLESNILPIELVEEFKYLAEVHDDRGRPSLTVFPYKMRAKDLYAFNRDVLVDRAFQKSEDQYKNMVDCLRHRIDPFAPVSSNAMRRNTERRRKGFPRPNSGAEMLSRDAPAAGGTITSETSKFEVLIELLARSDLQTRSTIFQLLLEQRFAIPLVVSRESSCLDSQMENTAGLSHLAEALRFVLVESTNRDYLSIARDTRLPRVVFVSNKEAGSPSETANLASEVLHCRFLSNHVTKSTGHGSISAVEFGVGFVKNPDENGSVSWIPCLAFCVLGDHNRLGKFLDMVADIVFVESEPCDISWASNRSTDSVFFWSSNSSKGPGEEGNYIWGPYKDLTESVSEILVDFILWKEGSGSGSDVPVVVPVVDCLKSTILPLHEETFISEVRSDVAAQIVKARGSFKLQQIFIREARLYFQALKKKRQQEALTKERLQLRGERLLLAHEVQDLPLLKTFFALLSEAHDIRRKVGILNFQQAIHTQLQATLQGTSRVEDLRYKQHQQDPNNLDLKSVYLKAKKNHVDHMLGLEHFWREMSHIFAADPRRKDIPKLAAYHLLDGFPLEILDGDAAMFQPLWVQSILVELETTLQDTLKLRPKIFVLSVVGLQSSGKSTLLNLMFGTQLRTSAGKCTRGVYLQVVKSDWPEFDYVLILDTEGLRAPEHFGQEGVEVMDNRMATFSILPADACIIMVANEEDNGLKDVLPMVMLAFKGSAMAEKRAGRIQAKLFFVYRGVKTNDVVQLKNNRRHLEEYLRDASSEIANMSICENSVVNKSSSSSIPSSSATIPLIDFRIDEHEENSDVKYFGGLKKGDIPHDSPDWDYGRKVVHLREYIHKRTLDGGNWVAQDFREWSDYLADVWKCIAEANFELGFLNRIQYARYHDLQALLASPKTHVGKKYQEEFENLAGELANSINAAVGSRERADWWTTLQIRVQPTIDEQSDTVQKFLKQKQWQPWEVEEVTRWSDFLVDLERHYQIRLQDCIDGALTFDNVVKEYNQKIQMEIEANAAQYHIKLESDASSTSTHDRLSNRDEKMKSKFQEIFERILRDARRKYPPMEDRVRSDIDKVYEEHIVGEKYAAIANGKNRVNSGSSGGVLTTMKQLLWNSRSGGATYEDLMLVDLIPKLQSCLEDARQSSDHHIRAVIELTVNAIKQRPGTKKEEETLHNTVKEWLTEKLQRIQRGWDQHHNVAMRLEEDRPRLQIFFENCANRASGTEMLSSDVSMVLKNALDISFTNHLGRIVSDNLQSEAFIRNWKVMRAYLDLHLVTLLEQNKINDVLDCVNDGSAHYETVLRYLVSAKVPDETETRELWNQFADAIKLKVKHAAFMAAEASCSDPVRTFLSQLTRGFSELKLGVLLKNIRLADDQVFRKYAECIDFTQVGDIVCQELTHFQFKVTSETKAVVVSSALELMGSYQSLSARPRCDVGCPHCLLTCFSATGHKGLHDTLHQPGGLCGIQNRQTAELAWRSCSRQVADDRRFIIDDVYIQFTDFHKHYPSWSLPSEALSGQPKVREYIFAKYQKELVQRYPGSKYCTDIPSEYLYDLQSLRCELENTVSIH